MAIINNVAYSWSMITLASTALGIEEGSTVLEGVSGIKWSKKRKIEPNYGLGGKPVSPGFRKHLLHGEHHDGLCHTADPALDLRQSDGHRRVRPDYLVRQPDGQR